MTLLWPLTVRKLCNVLWAYLLMPAEISSHNKSQEDQHLRTRRLQCPQRSNRRLHLGCTRPAGRPILLFKDVCKRDMKTDSINPANCDRWRGEQWEEKDERKKQMAETTAEPRAKIFKCSNCSRVCGSRVGL